MMHYTIRRAVKEDCARLMELVRELAAFENAADAVSVSDAHFMESGFGEHPVWWAFVAEAHGEVVGFALYYIRYSTWKGQQLYLEDILVTRDARGQGIGGALMARLFTEAKERNMSGVTWQALDWNQPALDFYTKLGADMDPRWINCSIAV
jgi:GNAT superfamily N-acetyltransferase